MFRVSVSATVIQCVTWYRPFQFVKQFNYVIFIAPNLHLIITAAVLEHVTRWTQGGGDRSEVRGRIGLGRNRTDEVEEENGR